MASFRKLKSGWRAEVARLGVRDSKVFPTKGEAAAWAGRREAEILSGEDDGSRWPRKTVADVLDRYAEEVSPTKKSEREERLRLAALVRDFPDLAAKPFAKVTPDDIGRWRDARKAQVSGSTVVRDATLYKHVWTLAIKEWGLGPEPSPWTRVKMPKEAHARTRLPEWTEIKRILRRLGYRTGRPPETTQQQVAHAWLLCLHTGLRAGEARGLTVRTVDMAARVLTLHEHKTVDVEGARFVPVTRKAARVLAVLVKAAIAAERPELFTISSQSLDVLFRKARDSQLIEGLRFHDSRGSALTRLSRKVDVLTLAKISGHRDLRQLLAAYYRESASSIAARL